VVGGDFFSARSELCCGTPDTRVNTGDLHGLCQLRSKLTSTHIAFCFALFRSLMRGGWRRRNSVAPQADSAALGIHGVDLHTKKWSYELILEPRETTHIASIKPHIVRSAAKLRERKNRHFISICSDYLGAVARLPDGLPRQFCRGQDGHAAPARSSH
jgi:hypothetical protein